MRASCTSTATAPVAWPPGSRAGRSRSPGSRRSRTGAGRTPPFITSTLQQEAARKLRFSSAADDAHGAAAVRERLHHLYAYRLGEPLRDGDRRRPYARSPTCSATQFVPPQPRRYTGKVKNAQEAHEAIRPAGDTFRTPGEVANELSTEEFKLYELIWRRTIASQMTDAVGFSVSVRIRAVSAAGEEADFARHRQDHHRPGLPARRTSSPPTTTRPRPRTPSAGCPPWPRTSR